MTHLQTEFDFVTQREFPTSSPINVKRLSGQNRRLLDFLLTGQRINIFSKAKQVLGIGYLNSRCADLSCKHEINISREYVIAKDVSGNKVKCMEYWIEKDEIEKIKRQWA